MAWNIEEEFSSRQETIKCVVVGDTAVGKTRLICARTCNAGLNLPQMLTTHVPTVWAIDQYRIHKEVLKRSWMSVDGVNVSLRLWDTFGDHEKDRKFAYGKADVVLLCFSISSPSSLNHCRTKWYPEIRQYCPQVPIVVVGCKTDLRHIYRDDGFVSLCNEKNRPIARLVEEDDLITRSDGRRLANEIGAVYYEVSVYTHYGIDNVFENAMRLALISRRQKRFWAKNLKNVMPPTPQMPYLPPKPKEPEVRSLASSFRDEMRSLLEKGFASDVTLKAAGEVFPAHRIILAAASSFFQDIFASSSEAICLDVNLADLQFVSPQSFQIFLNLLYSGELNVISDVPLGDIKEAAILTKIEIFEDLIEDIEDHDGQIKNHIQDSYLYHFKENLREICLVENLYTDVVFIVDDGECRAHRSVLMARCDVMAAMFGGDFKESSTEKILFPGATKSTFDFCLNYLYTDAVDEKNLTIHNAAEVIELANRLCLPHLISLVEKRIIKELKMKNARDGDISEYVFRFLEICQLHNADQLYEWCQYYIMTNYQNIELKHPTLLQKLDNDYQNHLQENKWPPQQYLTERDFYDTTMRKYNLENNVSGFTDWLVTKKKIAEFFHSFRRPDPPKIAPANNSKRSFFQFFARKSIIV